MSVYVISALFLAAVTGLLLWHSLRLRKSGAARQSEAVYRAQLAELEQDVALGKVAKADADAIRTEIARRLLAESKVEAKVPPAQARLPAIVFSLLIPAIAVPAYLYFGEPSAPDLPLSARLEKAVENDDLAAMIAQVEQRLAQKPDDARGWMIIAPVYAQMGHFGDAATAYQHLLRLEPPTAERYADLAEVLVFAAEGMVNDRASQALDEALALEPSHPKATYYKALALKQDGKRDEARKLLERLLAAAPADASWKASVQEQIASLAKAPALTDQQMADGQAMPANQQREMIEGMVNGLEEKLNADPADVNGWLKLIRARTVLGELDKAKRAYAAALGHFKSMPQELASINALAAELNLQ